MADGLPCPSGVSAGRGAGLGGRGVFRVLNSGTIGKLGCIARLKTFIGCVLG